MGCLCRCRGREGTGEYLLGDVSVYGVDADLDIGQAGNAGYPSCSLATFPSGPPSRPGWHG